MLKEFTVFLKIENLAVDEVHKRKYLVQPGKPLTLGRSKECHIVLVDENVSRKHARLKVDGDQLLIEDLKSGNGTFVNGEKTSRHNISEGQLVVLGGFEIQIMKIVGAPSQVVPDDIVIEEDTSSEDSSASEQSKNQKPDARENQSHEAMAKAFDQGLKGDDQWKGKMSVDGFKNILVETWKQFIEQKLDFFVKIPLAGEVKNSLIVISICAAIPVIIGVLITSSDSLDPLINALIGLVFAVGATYFAAKIFDIMRSWLSLSGNFENYLRFYAYSSLISLPFSLIVFVPFIGPFIAIFGLVVSVLFLYGFYIRFKPVLIRFIVACLLILVVQTCASMGASFIGPAEEIETNKIEGVDKNMFKRLQGQREDLEEAMEAN